MSYHPTPQYYSGNGGGVQYPPQQVVYGASYGGNVPTYGNAPAYGGNVPAYGGPAFAPERSPGGPMPPRCPQQHPLVPAPLHVVWRCDGCNTHRPQGTVAFQCRVCNFDLCEQCVACAGGGGAPAAASGGLTCPNGHVLTSGALTVVWNCDACRVQQSGAALAQPHLQCRTCDYDICPQCAAARQHHQQPHQQPSATGAHQAVGYGALPPPPPAPTAGDATGGVAARCPNGHRLLQDRIPSTWNCDLCCGAFPRYSESHGCRPCNYDLCAPCAHKAAPPVPQHGCVPTPMGHLSSLQTQQPLPSAAAAPQWSNRLKCFFVGVNYEHTAEALSGCVNDVRVVQALLQSIGYDISHSRTLVDVPTSGQSGIMNVVGRPNKRDIFEGFDWLVADAKPGDTLFFHFSGHGSQAADQDGDEDDGFDETIVPLDFRTAGQIRDDDLFDRLVRRVPRGCRLTCIADCCHSGSILDLPYIWYPPSSSVNRNKTKQRGFKLDGGIAKTCEGDVLLVSGCRDEQTSADVGNAGNFLASTGRTQHYHTGGSTNSGVFAAATSSRSGGGACTLSIVDALRGGRYKQRSFLQVLEDMLTCLSTKRLGQVPQFSASKPFGFDHPFSFSGPLPA